jgi:hypothetical protein
MKSELLDKTKYYVVYSVMSLNCKILQSAESRKVHDLRAMKNCCLQEESTNTTTRNKRAKPSTITLKEIENSKPL